MELMSHEDLCPDFFCLGGTDLLLLLGPEHVPRIIIPITTKVNRLFGGFNILKKSPNLAVASVAVKMYMY